MNKDETTGKLSIELRNKGNNIHSLEITSGLNDTQIGVLTDILCQWHKGEHGEVFCKLVEETIDTLAKIIYVYDRKIKGKWITFKE